MNRAHNRFIGTVHYSGGRYRFCYTEIGNFGYTLFIYQNIVGLNIPVYYSMFMVLVRRGEEEREFSVDPAAPHGFAENLSWERTREERNVWIRNVTAADGVM